ncbi:TetR/AcrR family transcriptional regulator [Azospirillum sp. CT11-132]|jgi:AcrR family transcriptional regulator|uniref:TetR/AcrR family transcriptional regulator n=1 Tax=unclassified Azospirillum TaxID=2630922 RepID=UPI000D60B107|nr:MULTISPECIES: TetR/AcrR family transcriptional regulator [unclassified Azospirillum]MCM8733941.1 TetR/AcrR family transcriptional regulator [Azospirillum sp. A1-3]PWC58499.1 transcriptional regulator [Azospirillum sp. TSH7]PWC72234.1 transcriptional regulator [Azospirillum sp. TSH20]PWC98467.1 transcriptional regulator [Azospirillum sp. TSO5]QCG96582.1 TetR/AcrR family transcriptional regulator [Azospirillum sp. TSA2s]
MPLDAEEIPDWRARRREVILNAAAELFAGRDYASVQVEEVAKRAGVGKATLYRYFPSKEELYLESLERALGGLEHKLNAELAPQQVPASVRLSAMVSALVGTLSEQLQTLKLLGGDQSDLADRSRRILRRRSQRSATALQQVLAEGMQSGEFRKIDLEIVPLLIIGMVRGGIMQVGDRPREALERSVIDLLMSGITNLPPFI